ncbi:MAG: AraC family transcriptional regulator, partial [Alphaproteobacteria bacterium]
IHDVVHGSELALPRDVALVAFADVVATLARDDTRGGHARETLPDHRSARLVDYLHTHVEANVGLDVLSSLAGLGRRQTIDLFKRRTGLPPHAYHVGLKVRLVQDLIRKGQSLVSAAAEAGFADQSHMTRHFTAIVGMTPAAFAHA